MHTRALLVVLFSLFLGGPVAAQIRPVVPTPTGLVDDVLYLEVLPTGDRAVVLGERGALRCVRLPDGQVLTSRNTSLRPEGLAVYPQGDVVAVWSGPRLHLYALPHLERILDTRRPGRGEFVWTGRRGFLRGSAIWTQSDLRTYGETTLLESFFHGGPEGRPVSDAARWGLLVPPESSGAEASRFRVEEGTVHRLGLETGVLTRLPLQQPFGDGLVEVARSPDGALLAATSGVQEWAVWDAATSRLLGQAPRHSGVMRGILPVMASTGPMLLAAGGNGSLRAIDVVGGTTRDLGRLHDQGFGILRATQDGRWLLSVGGGIAKVWELESLGAGPMLAPAPAPLVLPRSPASGGSPFGL